MEKLLDLEGICVCFGGPVNGAPLQLACEGGGVVHGEGYLSLKCPAGYLEHSRILVCVSHIGTQEKLPGQHLELGGPRHRKVASVGTSRVPSNHLQQCPLWAWHGRS